MDRVVWQLKTYGTLPANTQWDCDLRIFFCYIRFQNNYVQMHFIHVILKRNVGCIICFVSTGCGWQTLGKNSWTIYFGCNKATTAMLRKPTLCVRHHTPWTAHPHGVHWTRQLNVRKTGSPSLRLLLLYLSIYIFMYYHLSLNDVNVNHHFNGSWLPACKLLGLRIHRSPQLEALVACPWQWCFNGVWTK